MWTVSLIWQTWLSQWVVTLQLGARAMAKAGIHLSSRCSSQQLVHLVAQPLVQGPDALQVGPDFDHARNDRVVCHRPAFSLHEQQVSMHEHGDCDICGYLVLISSHVHDSPGPYGALVPFTVSVEVIRGRSCCINQQSKLKPPAC